MAVSFAAELQKARRRHDLLLCLLVPCMLVLWVGGLSKGVRRSWPTGIVNCSTAFKSSMPFCFRS